MSDPKQPEYSGFLGMSGGPAPRAAEAVEDNRPWEWKLTPVKYDLGFVQQPVLRTQTGERAGIQYFSGFERAKASDDCPLCTLKGPHAHGKEDLRALRKMVSFLESKLGVSSRPAIIEKDALRAAPSLPEEMPEWFEPILDADMTAKVIWSVLRAKVREAGK